MSVWTPVTVVGSWYYRLPEASYSMIEIDGTRGESGLICIRA